MVLRGKEFDEIHDLVGIRVIVGSVRDCYAVLGQVHATWRPVPGRFKDYIAMPKVNLYQSLHTSVMGPRGRPIEIQIRTRAMHQTAEFGVAAHWKYKDPGRSGGDEETGTEDLPWVEQLLEWQQEVQEPGDYLESLKIDLYQDEVFVFTPKGDVMGLPANATPIDFAYAVHTEVGHRCIGARVNGRLVPLDHQLTNGDTIEVMTSKAEDAGPSRDWLKLAASTRAQSKIRAYFNRERREDAIVRGRDSVARALKRKGIGYARSMAAGDLTDVAHVLNYKNTEAMFRAVGEGHVAAITVANQLVNELTEVEEETVESIADTVTQGADPDRSRRWRGCRGRGVRRHAGQARPLLHAGPRGRDRRVRHAGTWGQRPPGGLSERLRPGARSGPFRPGRPGRASPPRRSGSRSASKRSTASTCCVTSPRCSATCTSTSPPPRS
jgi:GTP diphosphokinase / guanosine-3',5'-bis(diphosphate) 3'-diphosphatase